MRITGGTLRSRTVLAPRGTLTRPTADRVREAMFSILDARVDWRDLNVVDLYAGSGALGFECLSRGAGHIFAVECDKAALLALRENARTLGVEARWSLFPMRAESEATLRDMTKRLGQQTVDILIADPPYSDVDDGSALEIIEGWVRTFAPQVVIVEHSAKLPDSTLAGFPNAGWEMTRRNYGDTSVSFFFAPSR
jgi:16S rRNA (guanine966-N2)-methyltransferase